MLVIKIQYLANAYEHIPLTYNKISVCPAKTQIRISDVARTPKKYAHERETTGSNSGSLQLRPILKWEFLLKERNCSQRVRIFSFKSSSVPYTMESNFYQIR